MLVERYKNEPNVSSKLACLLRHCSFNFYLFLQNNVLQKQLEEAQEEIIMIGLEQVGLVVYFLSLSIVAASLHYFS